MTVAEPAAAAPVQPPRTEPSVTVVVCAYTEDRWAELGAAVESALEQVPAPDQVVAVIDHNDGLLARARAHLSGVTVVANRHRRGLSGARNTAIELARRDIVAFLDDDAVAEPGWLQALLRHYTDPDVVAVGGAAIPVWPAARPLMYPAGTAHGELDWVVGCTYTGQPRHAAEVRNLMGCNMSFRRAVFERVGGFREDLGRVGRIPLGCEETELCIRVRRADPRARVVFEPRSQVSHRVSPDRVSWRYLAVRCYAEGISKQAVTRLGGRDAGLSSERSYVRAVLPRAAGRELRRLVAGDGAGLAGVSALVVSLTLAAAGFARAALPSGPSRSAPVRRP